MKKLLLTLPAFLALANVATAQCVPVFTDNADITTLPDPGVCTAVVTYSAPVFSGCASGTIVQTAGLPSGSTFPAGITTNTFVIDGTVFEEDFSDNTAGWTLGTEWQIGPAIGSTCFGYGSQDPTNDNSPSADNGIAGAVIGGCITTALHGYYYITSPIINTAGMTNLTFEYFRMLNSDYTPFMNNTVEVFDGATWQLLWQSGASPGVQDPAWVFQSFNISAYANANMQIRFGHNVGNAGAFTVNGWNIDDIAISGTLASPTSSFDVIVGETSTMAEAICTGDSYVFGTQTLSTAGTYVETFTNISGCDSIVTLTLAENVLYNETASDAVCTGDTYVFGSQNLTTAGTYVEVFTAMTGCDSTVTLTLTENTPPSITVTSTTDEISGNDGAIDITIGGGSTYSFSWSNSATSEDLTGIASGSYDVTVTDDATGCTATETIIVDSQVGIEENSSSIVTLYPNPTNGLVTLTFSQELHDAYVVITNVLGEEVYSENVSGTQKHELNLDKSTGIYFVNVYDQGNLITVMKVVKQ